MIKHAVSNIALPPFEHGEEVRKLRDMGLHGLEVAPSRVWPDTWRGLKPDRVTAYANMVHGAGLQIVGLHSLFFDHPELGLFHGPEVLAETLEFLTHLSGVCRDLGGRTLIYGGGRKRGDTDEETAYAIAGEFLSDYCRRTEGHGTCLCFEPLGPDDTDFILSAFDALRLVREISHPALKVQIDAKALVANDEASLRTFMGMGDELVHYHANEPGLGVLGETGEVDHGSLGGFLRQVGYSGFVSIEQRMFQEEEPLRDIAAGVKVLKDCYG